MLSLSWGERIFGPIGRRVRNWLHLAIRSKVAGPDAESRAQQIWSKPGPRWFTESDPIWRVNEDATMYPGGVAALLLQMLHPGPMAGVADHSDYRGDPWGRLQRTAHYLATTTYGTIDDAERAIAGVRRVHDHIHGTDHRGRPYSAHDPDLLRYVHIAETWSFLNAYRTWGAEPLTASEADSYVRQTNLAASRLGATDLPQSVAELDTALAAYRPRLEVSPAALEACAFLVRRPPLPWVARPGYWMVVAGGVSLLPPWARRALNLPASRASTLLLRTPGAVSTRVLRWAMAAGRS